MNGTQDTRPITVLIGALGGEGGGVLMNWIVNAAMAQGLPVQATSVAGVAQRTGATIYYIEILPVGYDALDGREPVLSLYPSLGDVDLVVASELVEVGRAIERGFVSPDRTTLIGCTHRAHSISERTSGADGRFDTTRILDAAPIIAQRAILFDAARVARDSGSVLNAVLLGTIAGSGVLPFPPSVFEDAIRTAGKAVDANLDGFAAGLPWGRAEAPGRPKTSQDTVDVESAVGHVAGAQTASGREAVTGEAAPRRQTTTVEAARGRPLYDRVRRDHPETTHPIVFEGTARLIDYQDTAYAALYLDRLDTILAVDADAAGKAELTTETGRYLALWMALEDVIRVAQLKTRRGRFEHVRREVGAHPDDIVQLIEFLKPGVEELCSILPSFVARPILRTAERLGWSDRLSVGMKVKTTTVIGFAQLWLMARLRPLRRLGHGFKEQQALIEEWLDLVRRAAARDQGLAVEVAKCAHLVRGYGDTRTKGLAHFRRIVEEAIEPALAGTIPPQAAVVAVAASRAAALRDPDTEGLAMAVTH